MVAEPHRDDRALLVTGGTGFVGHHVVAELLRRGRRVVALLRGGEERWRRLHELLTELGTDADTHVRTGQLMPMAAELSSLDGHHQPPALISGIIHAAAVTRFQADSSAEPWRTNVDGTRRLLDWAFRHRVRRLHFVSTAYTCGVTRQVVFERFSPCPHAFHNDYERAKWEAERLCVGWSRSGLGEATIVRPSIVVGAFDNGRATKFDGFYLSVRATELLDRAYAGRDPAARQSIPLRIRGRSGDAQNIVPVDYVAAMIVAIAIQQDRTRTADTPVYHLTHPHPPSNGQIKAALERHFQIGGGAFVAPERFREDDLNEHERLFRDVSRPIEHYMIDSPRFDRRRAEVVEADLDIRCPAYTTDALLRLFRYAQSARWGRRRMAPAAPAVGAAGDDCGLYFEHFLPAHIHRSRVARSTAMDVTIRFIVDEHGEWVCQFRGGRLAYVSRGANTLAEDFGYRASPQAFWLAISGAVHPQELFLTGRADIFGDVEQALKMAMILHAFSREFPCDRQTLGKLRRQPCSSS